MKQWIYSTSQEDAAAAIAFNQKPTQGMVFEVVLPDITGENFIINGIILSLDDTGLVIYYFGEKLGMIFQDIANLGKTSKKLVQVKKTQHLRYITQAKIIS